MRGNLEIFSVSGHFDSFMNDWVDATTIPHCNEASLQTPLFHIAI